jgi:hypothetical protein
MGKPKALNLPYDSKIGGRPLSRRVAADQSNCSDSYGHHFFLQLKDSVPRGEAVASIRTVNQGPANVLSCEPAGGKANQRPRGAEAARPWLQPKRAGVAENGQSDQQVTKPDEAGRTGRMVRLGLRRDPGLEPGGSPARLICLCRSTHLSFQPMRKGIQWRFMRLP